MWLRRSRVRAPSVTPSFAGKTQFSLNWLEAFDSNLTLTQRESALYAGTCREYLVKTDEVTDKGANGLYAGFLVVQKQFNGRLSEGFVQASYLVVVHTVQEVRVGVHGLDDG